MDRKTPSQDDTTTTSPNAVEKRRRPDGGVTPGESHGKRTNEERNDPEVEPGAAEGQLRDHPAQI
jgi:hypothetical protein